MEYKKELKQKKEFETNKQIINIDNINIENIKKIPAIRETLKFSNIVKNTITEQVEKYSNCSKIEMNFDNYSFINEFRTQTLDERKKICDTLMEKHPHAIPIIVDCKNDIKLLKKKYIVPKTLTMGQFMYMIKKKLSLDSTQSIFLLCNNILLNNTQMIINIYNRHHDDDGFLYIILTLENVFG